MHLKNEDDTRKAIKEWQNFSEATQATNLHKAIDTMELDQMYYDQKGNERGKSPRSFGPARSIL